MFFEELYILEHEMISFRRIDEFIRYFSNQPKDVFTSLSLQFCVIKPFRVFITAVL